jgi:AraC-like DNA-binding protein
MQPFRIKTIREYHEVMKLPKPEHPLISIIDYATIDRSQKDRPTRLVFDFYSISLKRNFAARIKYGQQQYDFDDGILFFIAPGQVFGIEAAAADAATATAVTAATAAAAPQHSGWMLLIHPDFLWNTPLAKTIRHYEYFDYAVNEALFLSEKEEATLTGIVHNIRQEYRSAIDTFSQNIIIAQIELLLTYSERFYHRQFITRKIANHQVLSRLESLLNAYFDGEEIARKGLPTVTFVAQSLNVSPGYLGSLLRVLTGLNTQQHIHQKLIEKAKEKLSTTSLSVSEIAYELGFEHPQSFSKLFKTKTRLSPQEFRQSFN